MRVRFAPILIAAVVLDFASRFVSFGDVDVAPESPCGGCLLWVGVSIGDLLCVLESQHAQI